MDLKYEAKYILTISNLVYFTQERREDYWQFITKLLCFSIGISFRIRVGRRVIIYLKFCYELRALDWLMVGE